MRWIVLVLALASCTPKSEPRTPEDPDAQTVELYEAAVLRLERFVDDGFVVSRWEGGAPEHQGDSLIWTGMALGSLPCDKGTKLAMGLRRMVGELGGGLWRHPTMMSDVSMDGALGFYWGIARRIHRCGEAEFWAPAIAEHVHFLDTHDVLKLNAGSTASLVPGFDYLPRLLAYEADVGGRPPTELLHSMQIATIAWTMAVKSQRAAAFRVHLSMIALQTVEELGHPLRQTERSVFCAVSKEMDMPTVDHFCGRPGLKEFVADFEYNRWEVRHQRAGAWETPDGKEGLETPAVDLLVALTTAYTL